MGLSSKIRTIFRGDVRFLDLPREALRRAKAAGRQRGERGEVDQLAQTPARLSPDLGSTTGIALVTHFREKPPFVFSGASFLETSSGLFTGETASLVAAADEMANRSSWDLAGFGVLSFDRENAWRRDPLGDKDWGTDYHADVAVNTEDGADIRVLWELNRFGHAVTLARAFAMTNDEVYAETFFKQLASWMRQNPYGRGANWSCAMEVALRAINVLAAFDLLRRSKACSEERLIQILMFFDQHGRFIHNNDEFSYIATSNHYLSNVVGLFWIGTCLPELERSAEWREFGLREILGEMDKQVLADGADFEASTGYHKFVTEMLLYTFLIGKRGGVEIPHKYWRTLRQMLEYVAALARADGRIPLIGDADGSQIVPVIKRDADDAAYLLAMGAVVFDEPKFKEVGAMTPELAWLLDPGGTDAFRSLNRPADAPGSEAFPNAGSYIMRGGDLYMHFNTNGCGVNGRGSHAHNDALSIEASAFGRDFIVDPGSYVYNLDRQARHLFRSTLYHSTVMVDGLEQNTTSAALPFIIGNEAEPKLLSWETTPETDRVSAEHYGYRRLGDPVTHRRSVKFDKVGRCWIVEDGFTGRGEHVFSFSFHLAGGLAVEVFGDGTVNLADDAGRELLMAASGIDVRPEIIPASRSRGYGQREPSQIVRWTVTAAPPLTVNFLLLPTRPCDRDEMGLAGLGRFPEHLHPRQR